MTGMRLYYSPASPFARKCRIVVREKGLQDRVEDVRVDPLQGGVAYRAINPLSQVPSLVDTHGTAWFDSPLICARLEEMGAAPALVPAGEARWEVLRREVIADGAMELGVKWRLESLRPEGERSQTWMSRWREGVLAALSEAERTLPAEPTLDLGSIAAVCALTWLDFRFPDLGWREGRPRLQALQRGLEERPSFRETLPS